MSKIFYSVQGDGRGHANRSAVVIDHLLEQGHDVQIFTSNTGLEVLFPLYGERVHRIFGLHAHYSDGQMSVMRPASKQFNPFSVMDYFLSHVRLYKMIQDNHPDVLFTDFETLLPFWGKELNIPVVSVNNQDMLRKVNFEAPYAWFKDYAYAASAYDTYYRSTKRADYAFITSFFFPPIKNRFKDKTFFVGPLIKKSVQKAKTSDGDHVLMYVTKATSGMLAYPQAMPQTRFIIYGFGQKDVQNNMVFKGYGEDEFVADVASCCAVVINGGLTLLGESLFLGKPVFCMPLGNQFEQKLNAYYLDRLGYGTYTLNSDIEAFKRFWGQRMLYQNNISAHADKFFGNEDLFRHLNNILEGVNTDSFR